MIFLITRVLHRFRGMLGAKEFDRVLRDERAALKQIGVLA